MVGTDDARVAPVAWTRYGAEAYDALRAAVAEAKRGDPLAPVTVLVPTQPVRVAARRALAHGVDGRAGVAGLVGANRRPAGRADRRARAGRVGAAAGHGSGAGGRLAAGAGRGRPASSRRWRGIGRPCGRWSEAHRELRDVEPTALDAIAGNGEPSPSIWCGCTGASSTLLAADVVRRRRTCATTRPRRCAPSPRGPARSARWCCSFRRICRPGAVAPAAAARRQSGRAHDRRHSPATRGPTPRSCGRWRVARRGSPHPADDRARASRTGWCTPRTPTTRSAAWSGG